MTRAVLVALVLASSAPAALAGPEVRTGLPVAAASLDDGTLRLRLADSISRPSRASGERVIVITARDASGEVTGERRLKVQRRMSYASIALEPNMLRAARIEVSAR